jgi:hypothetical protein
MCVSSYYKTHESDLLVYLVYERTTTINLKKKKRELADQINNYNLIKDSASWSEI